MMLVSAVIGVMALSRPRTGIKPLKNFGHTQFRSISKANISVQKRFVSVLIRLVMKRANRSIVCDPGSFKIAEMESLIRDEESSEENFPGILLQLEATSPQHRRGVIEMLKDEHGEPVRGPHGDPLRDLPGVPNVLNEDMNHWLLLALLRQYEVLDLVQRWPKKIGRTAMTQKTGRWRKTANFPIFPWEHKRERPTMVELEVLEKLSPLQIDCNTGGIPVVPGFAVRPKPREWFGHWNPSLSRIISGKKFPFKHGPRMGERQKALKDVLQKSAKTGRPWREIFAEEEKAKAEEARAARAASEGRVENSLKRKRPGHYVIAKQVCKDNGLKVTGTSAELKYRLYRENVRRFEQDPSSEYLPDFSTVEERMEFQKQLDEEE
jgi:hypothetical protein